MRGRFPHHVAILPVFGMESAGFCAGWYRQAYLMQLVLRQQVAGQDLLGRHCDAAGVPQSSAGLRPERSEPRNSPSPAQIPHGRPPTDAQRRGDLVHLQAAGPQLQGPVGRGLRCPHLPPLVNATRLGCIDSGTLAFSPCLLLRHAGVLAVSAAPFRRRRTGPMQSSCRWSR